MTLNLTRNDYTVLESECRRQGVDHSIFAPRLALALTFAYYLPHEVLVSPRTIRQIASAVNTGFLDREMGYRRGPAVFFSGGTAADAFEITERMELLAKEAKNEKSLLTLDKYIKEFLWIHPFQDGNGRTAMVLYNSIRTPYFEPIVPLPYYFGSA